MPTPTPNRGYPAPVPSDPADIPAAMQAIADAVDTDLATYAPQILARPFFRMTASAPQVMPFTTVADLVFTDLEENTNGALPIPPVMPVSSVRLPTGYWLVTATAAYGIPGGGGTLDEVTLRLINNGVQGILSGSTVHSTPSATDGSRTLSTTMLCTGNSFDDTRVVFSINKVGGINPTAYNVFSRSLTATKVADL